MTALNPGAGYSANPLFNALIPDEGPKGIAIVCPFSSDAGPFTVDFRDEIQGGRITNIQGFYIDNSANNAAVTITVQGNNQKLTIKAKQQGYLAALAQKVARFEIASSGATGDVILQFLNVPMPMIVWDTV